MEEEITLYMPYGEHSSNCGYCKKGRSYTTSFNCKKMTSEVYQRLIDKGWRRSGYHMYKPNLIKSCCPQYTIRLNAAEFKTKKKERKIINKMLQFVNVDKTEIKDPSLEESIQHIFDSEDIKFELKKSTMDEDSFELYKKYQSSVHKEDDVDEIGFNRFLIETPLNSEKDEFYGSYHYKYYYKGELIALEVLDILPNCLSSVYFMYDEEYKKLSLGKYSALHSIYLVQQYFKEYPDIKYYYMGFYIHSCPKMKYKADYEPSYLLDPETYIWVPFSTVLPLLEENKDKDNGFTRFAPTSNPNTEFPGALKQIDFEEVLKSKILIEGYIFNFKQVRDYFKPKMFNVLESIIKALGLTDAHKFITDVSN